MSQIQQGTQSNITIDDGNLSFNGNSTIGDNRRVTVSAGTAVQLSASSVPCRKVYIQALSNNTDAVVVGGSTVVALEAGRRGFALNPFNSIVLTVSNLNLVYLDSVVSAEGVSYIYEN